MHFTACYEDRQHLTGLLVDVNAISCFIGTWWITSQMAKGCIDRPRTRLTSQLYSYSECLISIEDVAQVTSGANYDHSNLPQRRKIE